MSTPPVWHFGRPALATVTLNTLQTGLAQAVTIMSARQMGKTEFLQEDLLTHAGQTGWRVRYFGCATVSSKVLLRRLEEGIADFAAGEKWLMQQFARLTGKQPVVKRKFSEKLVSELAQLRSEKKPSLLLLDDIDRVLQLPNGESIVREILQTFAGIGGRARLIATATMTGGNHGIPALLQQQTSVFTLPDIGDAFVHHLVNQYQQLTQSKRQGDSVFGKLSSPYQGITWGQVDEGIMLDAFNRLQRIPHYFRALVEDLVLNPERSPAEALQMQLARLQRYRVSALSWEEMSRLDRLLLLEVAKGTAQFYGNDLRERLASQAGVAQVSASQVQSSLKKLMRNQVLAQQSDGRYQIIDPHLAVALSAQHGAV